MRKVRGVFWPSMSRVTRHWRKVIGDSGAHACDMCSWALPLKWILKCRGKILRSGCVADRMDLSVCWSRSCRTRNIGCCCWLSRCASSSNGGV